MNKKLIFHSLNSIMNSSPDYRFGFNGMLRDDDVREIDAPIQAEEGRGNSYSTEFRGYMTQKEDSGSL